MPNSRESLSRDLRAFIVRLTALSLVVLLALVVPSGPIGLCAEENRVIHVGSELEFPPYAFTDGEGRPTGFSIDLIRAVADTMGLVIQISTGSWDMQWQALVKGHVEILPIVARSPERKGLVDFSIPHTETFDAFFVREGEPLLGNIGAARGKEIAVMRSDAAHHELAARGFRNLVLVGTIPEGLALIASGKHDAFLCSKLIGTLAIESHGLKGLQVGHAITDYKRVFSFGVKKGETELLEKLNQGLLIVKTNGTYDRIYDKWLTYDDPWRKLRRYLLPAGITLLAAAAVILSWLVTLQVLVKRRTRELRQARETLEIRVEQRTLELAGANRKLESFTYSVSHDLRAPLRSIDGFSKMLLRDLGPSLDEDSRRKLQVIRDGVERMNRLIDDLLNLSRLGRQAVRPTPTDMKRLFTESWEEICQAHPDRTAQFSLGDLDEASADRALLKQVMLNLLSNALKFTRGRQPARIEIDSARRDGFIVFSVKDNGVGFDMKAYDKLFGVFQRLHSKNEFEGTGVGLAIVQRIIQRHGGRVWAESEVGTGATFHFALPAAEPAASSPPPPRPSQPPRG